MIAPIITSVLLVSVQGSFLQADLTVLIYSEAETVPSQKVGMGLYGGMSTYFTFSELF